MKLSPDQMSTLDSEILKRVRARPGISRISLARTLQIAPSTVGNYVGRLLTEGFLVESEKADRDAGRPPTALRLNPDSGQFIGVDFEARKIMAMAVDFSDRPLKHSHQDIQSSDTAPEVVEKIERAIEEVLPENQGRLLAIGVGVPGLVDPDRGMALDYKYIRKWRNVPLAVPLSKRFGVPVYLENTIRSMALAELWFGQGRGVRDWICVGIRSGLGAGIVVGGQLHRGADYRAGEVGRWRMGLPKRPGARFFLTNGDTGAQQAELQEIASARSILAALERARMQGEKTVLPPDGQPLVFADVVRAAQLRDKLTVQVLEVAAEALGWAVSQLALALNPSLVILAGPLTLLGDTLLQPLRKHAQELLKMSGAETPAIVNSTMGEFSGALGAAALAVHEWKPAR
jgi:N-acetylglucosamine repressor